MVTLDQSRIILEDQDPFADTSQEVEDYVDSHLQPGFAYSIFDCFTNGKFNMVYVQKIPDWEIKMRREYLEALKETTNRKTRDQILEIKKKRKDLRARIKDEDKKRTDLIMKDPLSYRLFKIMSNVSRVSLYFSRPKATSRDLPFQRGGDLHCQEVFS